MYGKFTDGAGDVLVFANQEAARYGHEYIGTEHLLLGLAADNEGVTGRIFKELGLRAEAIRSELEKNHRSADARQLGQAASPNTQSQESHRVRHQPST